MTRTTQEPRDNHTCNAWCTGDTHTHVVLISPTVRTEADVLTRIAGVYRQLSGRCILHARPAPEADHAALITARTGELGISTSGRVRPMPRQALERMRPWLIVYRNDSPPLMGP